VPPSPHSIRLSPISEMAVVNGAIELLHLEAENNVHHVVTVPSKFVVNLAHTVFFVTNIG
jgi:hypothetical protein